MPAQRAQRRQAEAHRRVAGDRHARHQQFVGRGRLPARLAWTDHVDVVPAQPQTLFLGLHGERDARKGYKPIWPMVGAFATGAGLVIGLNWEMNGMFLPPIVTLIPLYRLVGSIGLNASLAGVIVPNLANAFGVFLMRQFIAGVPDDLIDAARVDGASELRIVFTVVAPAVVPAIAALALFAFVYHWNTYLWPLTVLQGQVDNYPIVLSLSRLLSYNRGAMNTGLVMAGATMAVLPPLVMFLLLQRFFVDSIVSSGVKG